MNIIFMFLLFFGLLMLIFIIGWHKKIAPWLIVFIILTSLFIISFSIIMILSIGFFMT